MIWQKFFLFYLIILQELMMINWEIFISDVISSPTIKTWYSAALLEHVSPKTNENGNISCSGDINTTPAPVPSRREDPSKKHCTCWQLFSQNASSLGNSYEVPHFPRKGWSTRKLASFYPFTTFWGVYMISYWLNNIDHLARRPKRTGRVIQTSRDQLKKLAW